MGRVKWYEQEILIVRLCILFRRFACEIWGDQLGLLAFIPISSLSSLYYFLPIPCLPKVRTDHSWLSPHAYRRSHLSAIREYDAKLLLAYWLERAPAVAPHAQVKTKFVYPAVKVAQIAWDPATNSITPDSKLPGWVFNTKLVAKPDQLIKRRGKAGLLALNKTWDEAKPWIAQRAGKPQKVSLSLSCDTDKMVIHLLT
jgi:hypothetical protein